MKLVTLEAKDHARDASRDVMIASDDAITNAMKRITRDHRGLIIALAK